MSGYMEWVWRLQRDHRARQGHGQRHTGCWACDTLPMSEQDRMRCRELSGGIVDGDHLIQQQVLRREHRSRNLTATALELALWDPRVGVPMRRWHHDQRHACRLVVPRERLPWELEEFAADLGLGWYLDRTYGELAAAA